MANIIVYLRDYVGKSRRIVVVARFETEAEYEVWYQENVCMGGHWWTEFKQADGTYSCRKPQ